MICYRTAAILPPDKTWVLAHRVGTNWHATATNPEGCYWKVVCFERGISMAEREKMPDDSERKGDYFSSDVWGNNQKPYYWWEFGPGSHFGQDIDLWCHLPETS